MTEQGPECQRLNSSGRQGNRLATAVSRHGGDPVLFSRAPGGFNFTAKNVFWLNGTFA